MYVIIILFFNSQSIVFWFQWKEPLINLLDLARRDADDWIETVADMYREYPIRQCIIPIPTNADSYFCKSLDELRKMGKVLSVWELCFLTLSL